jgi:short-subunit dehydrogenase
MTANENNGPQTALITGASQGLGTHIAQKFAREGSDLILTARSEQRLIELEERLEHNHDATVRTIPANLRETARVNALVDDAIQTLGSIEALINNAGVYHRESFESTDRETFDEQYEINCRAPFLLMKEFLPNMAERGNGFVCNLLATGAVRGSEEHAAFNASKFGLRALTESAAKEYQHRGVHVTGLIIDGQINSERIRESQPDRPTDTLLQPESIAEEILHLYHQPRDAWTLETDLRPHREYEYNG